jgi:hypothetical protein
MTPIIVANNNANEANSLKLRVKSTLGAVGLEDHRLSEVGLASAPFRQDCFATGFDVAGGWRRTFIDGSLPYLTIAEFNGVRMPL